MRIRERKTPNLQLLKVVRTLIKAVPKRLDMEHWGRHDPVEYKHSCGTTACLAGWIVLAAEGGTNTTGIKRFFSRSKTISVEGVLWEKYKGRFGYDSVPKIAAKLIGIPLGDLPFWNTHWDSGDVVMWLDEKIKEIEGAKKQRA